MKRLAILLTATIISLTAAVCHANTSLEAADSAYLNADYTAALSLYQKAVANDGTSADLLYNLGNSYYRSGNLPQAILAYERALRLDPTHSEARQNLEFVNTKIIDRPGSYGTFFSRASKDIASLLSSNAWAWLGLVMFALMIGGCSLYVFSENVTLRKAGFFGSLLFLIIAIFAIVEAFQARSISVNTNEAIITAKSVILSTSPRQPMNRTEEAMLLHEGTKLYIIDSVAVGSDSLKTVWLDVMVDNDHRAWIESSAAERI